jgi:hypothetical protein
MEATATGRLEGRTTGPVVNEMLLHDVYELPRELLRGALRATAPAVMPDQTRIERIPTSVLPGGPPCRTPPMPRIQKSS